ncbi:uncharacterized protein K02A2.6-like isoform X1 [Ochlerotatus camptorhynchus]|uniref:uncharacterized protein K02A2.6-like isoform X1 n=1 Tax=Ochlerotatus camptorhynchus TaxID=644619 RepID=UPI0031D63F1A
MECMLISSIKTINEPCFRTVVVEGVRLEMEIDCGAAVSVISSETYEGEFADISMQKCTKKLAVISGSRLVVEGQIPVQVELNGRRKTVKLIVLRSGSSFTPLLGRDWLDIFYSDWRNAFGSGASVNQLSFPASEEQIVDDVKGRFANIFDKSMFTPIKGFQADLVLKKGAVPIFKRAYDVPLRLKDKVDEHLESLEKDGVITPIDASEWASPVIVVVKKDGGIRMVIDCKVSINQVSVGGRVYSAHRNQLKLVGTPKRRGLFLGRSESSQRRKRAREDDDDDDRLSINEEGDFYGFASDSFIYGDGDGRNRVNVRDPESVDRRSLSSVGDDVQGSFRIPPEEFDPQEGPSNGAVCPSSQSKNSLESVRRSKRSKRLKKDVDFVYL